MLVSKKVQVECAWERFKFRTDVESCILINCALKIKNNIEIIVKPQVLQTSSNIFF